MPATGVASTGVVLREVPPCPLGEEVLQWVLARLLGQGVHRPTCKRLAVLVAGLLATTTVQRGELTAAVARLQLSAATEPRSRFARQRARRLERLLDDPQLDPERIVPPMTAALLPTLLAEVCEAHAVSAAGRRARAGSGPGLPRDRRPTGCAHLAAERPPGPWRVLDPPARPAVRRPSRAGLSSHSPCGQQQ
jgi:hypothetical protein